MEVTAPIFSILAALTIIATISAAPPPPHRGRCTAELVAFSSCLDFASSPPNNVSSFASPECCDFYSATVDAGHGFCFCYLLRDSSILGFPVNTTRILDLSSLCAVTNADSKARSVSLESTCAALKALSPLQTTEEEPEIFPSPTKSSDPKHKAQRPPPPPSDTATRATYVSSATKLGTTFSWFLPKNPLLSSGFSSTAFIHT